MKYPRKVYAIRHNVTNRVYIGSSSNVDRRIGAHISALRRGAHINEDMQADFDANGEDYTFTVLDNIENPSESEKEYEWMKRYESNVRGKGYNYKDRKDIEGIERKSVDPETEIIELIRKSENPERAYYIALKIIVDNLLFSAVKGGNNEKKKIPRRG